VALAVAANKSVYKSDRNPNEMKTTHGIDSPEGRMGTDKTFALGILFVHGIGTQSRGHTLAAFGGPFYRWLDSRCDGLGHSQPGDLVERGRRKLEAVDWADASVAKTSDPATAHSTKLLHRVVLRETKFRDPLDLAAPAHTRIALLSLDSCEEVSVENWLLAESYWADTFSSPNFADFARWSFGMLPWIVGSHFGAQVQRRIRERPRFSAPKTTKSSRTQLAREIWAFSGWTWRLAAAIGGLAVGFLSTVVTVPILALILVLGLLPISKLRSALLNIQLRLAGTIGDSFVLLARPIEAASIVSKVRHDLAWLAGKCSEVVIVAHSQGGAIAHLALRGSVPKEFRLLFTFGSGLRKLEEARELMKTTSSYVLSAVLTSIALVMLLLCSSVLFMAAINETWASVTSIGTIAALAVVAVVFLIAGIRDHLRGIPLAELERWIEWLKTSKLRWRDCYATADPVPNGVVSEGAKAYTREVCNRSSMFSDHTTYWSNLDEFVSALYGEIAESRTADPLPDLRIERRQLDQIARCRRWRVALGRAIDWAVLAGVVAVVVRQSEPVRNFAAWAWSRTGAWLFQTLVDMKHAGTATYSIHWTTVLLLASLLTLYAIVRKFWADWDRKEMTRSLAPQNTRPANNIIVLTGLCSLLLFAMGIWRSSVPSVWQFALCLVLPVLIFTMTDPSLRDGSAAAKRREPRGSPVETIESEETFVGSLSDTVISLVIAASLLFSLGLSGWSAIVWLSDRLFDGRLGGFRPASIPSEAVGVGAVVVSALAWVIWRFVRK
jgi:hypothetical protein